MRLALYQPDIPQNTGTLIRTCACLGAGLDIIEPCGFLLDDKRLKRSQMDYRARADVVRHVNFDAFAAARPGRIVLVETGTSVSYTTFAFRPDDTLLLGSESRGTPPEVAARCDAAVHIPMAAGVRSLNLAIAASIVLAEALRQTALGHSPVEPAVDAR